MKPARSPRALVILILLLVAAAFLNGTLRLIHDARAAEPSPAALKQPAGVEARFAIQAASSHNQAAHLATPVPTDSGPDLSAQATPTAIPVSADTGGIIALAIVIVATILVGAAWGLRRSAAHK